MVFFTPVKTSIKVPFIINIQITRPIIHDKNDDNNKEIATPFIPLSKNIRKVIKIKIVFDTCTNNTRLNFSKTAKSVVNNFRTNLKNIKKDIILRIIMLLSHDEPKIILTINSEKAYNSKEIGNITFKRMLMVFVIETNKKALSSFTLDNAEKPTFCKGFAIKLIGSCEICVAFV